MWWGCDRVHHVTPAELDWTACEDWRRKDSLQDKWRCLGIIPCVWSLMSHKAGAADYVNRLIKTVGNCTRILLLLLIEGVLLVWVPRKIFWLLHLLDTRITTLWLLASTCMAAQTHVLTRSFMTPIKVCSRWKSLQTLLSIDEHGTDVRSHWPWPSNTKVEPIRLWV